MGTILATQMRLVADGQPSPLASASGAVILRVTGPGQAGALKGSGGGKDQSGNISPSS